MKEREELGGFLRSRRARLKPEDVALKAYGERRRVPGLRREELAQLAGLSADYYVRFEQGRADQVSDSVIDAVATALRLSGAERAHLHNLARAVRSRHPAPNGEQEVRPGLLRLLDSLAETPAYVLGRRTDLLAWTPLFARLMVDPGRLAPKERNKARLVFLNDEMRARFVDWPQKARDVVAYLRMDLARHPGDPGYDALVGELSERSADFHRLWDEHEVRDKTHGGYRLRHPLTGEFAVGYETLRLPDDPDQALITYTAEPGSPSEEALRLIAAQEPQPAT